MAGRRIALFRAFSHLSPLAGLPSRRAVVDRRGALGRPARMAQESGDGTALAGEAQLRTAAFLVLAAVLVFFPLQLVRVGPEARPLLSLVFGLHGLLASAVLALSYTAFGARHADRVGLVFVLGL